MIYTTLKKELPYVAFVLKEMCRRVKAPLSIINKDSQWFTKYTWSSKEEDSFKVWMLDYLINNKDARIEFLAHPIKNKKALTRVINWFILNYGWSIKD